MFFRALNSVPQDCTASLHITTRDAEGLGRLGHHNRVSMQLISVLRGQALFTAAGVCGVA